jgi:hypothetical protein
MEVVAMNPLHAGEDATEGAAYKPTDKPETYRKPEQPVEKAGGRVADPATNPPPPPQP